MAVFSLWLTLSGYNMSSFRFFSMESCSIFSSANQNVTDHITHPDKNWLKIASVYTLIGVLQVDSDLMLVTKINDIAYSLF